MRIRGERRKSGRLFDIGRRFPVGSRWRTGYILQASFSAASTDYLFQGHLRLGQLGLRGTIAHTKPRAGGAWTCEGILEYPIYQNLLILDII